MKKILCLRSLLALTVLLLGAQSTEALTLMPGDADYSGYTFPPDTNQIELDAQAACGCVFEEQVYKYDTGNGDSGDLESSYTTTLGPAGDESGGTIAYNGGNYFSGSWLLIKDGNANPNWYLFDISGWNGKETITLSGFWAGTKGSISHLSLYGTVVPEPATLSLLALGLIGVGVVRRRTLLT